jgi:carbonic anhydrase
MKKLLQGIINFREKEISTYKAQFATLVQGQSPEALFITCCDSRVVPYEFTSAHPGEIFVLRNIGNIVPIFEHKTLPSDLSVSAALEFSIEKLKVPNIVVCGHSECAAMKYFTENSTTNPSLIKQWLEYAKPSYDKYLNLGNQWQELAPHNKLARLNVVQQSENLLSYPFIKNKLQQKLLTIHSWWFDLESADVYYYNDEINDFEKLDTIVAKRMLKQI